MAAGPQMIFNNALPALNLPETQLPIVLADLETKNNPPNGAIALKVGTVRMFETHRVRAGRSDIYNTESASAGNAPAER